MFDKIKSYVIITLALMTYSIGLLGFILPAGVVSGGVTGIATYVYLSTGIPIGLSIIIANSVLVALSLKILGKGFGAKTIFSIIMLSFTISLFQSFFEHPIVPDTFMAIIIGGSLMGLGIGIVFTQSGSTGGLDIVVMIINKYKNISPGKLLIIFDFFIITSSWFLHHSLENIVYGIVSVIVISYVIDLVIVGSKQSVQIMIISKKFSSEIADMINQEVDRGVTILKGKGWYSKDDIDVVMVVVRKFEIHYIYKIIKDIDPDSFLSIGNVMGVYGKGFDRLRI
ncbi:MAG: YitT family protein [Candidatus Delongbacteria bacterium]|nr:YitT family protein [Candidatus Delongbacteria bacterium]MBN2835675.1 YitT family protein [Candidatus Delongbacteria bacterium]